ncbi:MAG: GNAT family N-acetyltransferase [Chloroflexia bacterium]|nr:GNAT family N-acetyltransferase [Chloroflexia bacterium]
MNIEFKRLTEVNKISIIELMNNPLVRRQMPLLTNQFNESICNQFINAKEKLWAEYGYGPWAFIVNGNFAGWGGLQPEKGEADLAIVLHPNYWGIGKVIYDKIMKKAFGEMGLRSVTVLFPPSRTRINGLIRLGFKMDGELEIVNTNFIRFRIENHMTPT